MGVYQKMKAAIFDLTEVLDEAVALNSAVPAMAGGPSINRTNIRFDDYGITSRQAQEQKKYGNGARFTQICVS